MRPFVCPIKEIRYIITLHMNYNNPEEIANQFSSYSIHKTRLPFAKFAILAFLGGTFIAFGGLLTVIVAGGMPQTGMDNPGLVKLMAGALFPIGLIMVSVAGADLFTSDCAGMALPCLQRKINISALLRIWGLSYVFNFLGAQFVAFFLADAAGLLSFDPWRSYLHNLAEAKTHYSFDVVFLKGIGANWLVCLGAWLGFAAKDIAGKAIGIWIPVMTFVTIGFEHSIANMFFIPAAIYSGADITWGTFVSQNLIPATLGNIAGGAVFVGCAYWYVYLRAGHKAEAE